MRRQLTGEPAKTKGGPHGTLGAFARRIDVNGEGHHDDHENKSEKSHNLFMPL